ncbi:amino acid adenylation domain-containing protein [Nonomuraea turkmeniaca]|uniref:Amino acid adenylation domain-containing protein n=1 Tax=Nonomuraea turkmeniaca TaxID=103838 RepID=A0A5S4G7Q4_9ACTN|nr:non-ribosomal peptide synthetase [Nonomuraea turkmeniaca]TMR21980.1 amino acid adenylation domain-containing protein [Nonomuraea turkmeniaca]
MNGGTNAEEQHVIARVNVRSADQPIAEQAARIVGGLRRGAYDVVDVALLDDHRFETVGFRHGLGGQAPAECLHDVVAWRARACPDALAVVAGTRRLTYSQVDAWARALAGRLRELGVGPEARVVVCLPRSPELVVAALAVLKAGGVYVPVHPGEPEQRLRFVIEDTQAAAVVTMRGATVPAPIPVVGVDESGPLDEAAVGVAPDNLAYIMYTSGSTGMPKGVMVPHRAALNYLWEMGVGWRLGPGDVTLQLAHPSFSASIRDLLGPLLHGAAVEVPTDEQVKSPGYLVERLTGGVTCVLSCLPSLLRAVLGAWPDRATTTLRLALVISEPFAPDLLALTRRRWGPDVRLVHQYGLTECAMTSLWWECGGEPMGAKVPIGLPIPNVTAHILDDRLHPVRPGEVGELYIGGAGLARGYLNSPARTAEKFLAAPPGVPGERLFRTGDLARHGPGGVIEFVGRKDHQVKVRGFRVELGEIELALGAYEQVLESAVTLAEVNGTSQLVAYVVPAEGAALTPALLRGLLRGTLPGHLVPARYVILDALPRTTSGKIDRGALAPLDRHRPDLGVTYTAPRDGVERVLADIWCDVLHVDLVGIHDDLFDLGCDSLLLIAALARIRARLGADVPVDVAFHQPTVAAMAERIRERPPAGPPQEEPPVPDGPGSPLTHAQRRLWFVEQLSPGRPLYTVAAAWRLRGALDVAVLQQAVDWLVARHDSLRTVFTEDGAAAVVKDDLRVAVQPHPAEAAEDVAALVDGAAQRPFDLATGPLLRVAMFRLRPETHVLLLTAHHIIIDGRGMDVLLDEFAHAYTRMLEGEEPALPPPPARQADLPVREAAMEYWRGRLAGAPPLTGMPFERPRRAVPGVEGALLRTRMPYRLADDLEKLARQAGATFFMAGLAGWAALLSRWSGQDDLVIAVPVAGRDRLEDERLVGCLMNMLPIRVDLTGAPSYLALLERVRAAVLSALSHRETPFDRLVGEVARGGRGRPLAEVLFDVEREPPPLRLPGLQASRLDVHTGTAKSDVSLTLRRGAASLECRLEYDTALFDEAMMGPLAEQVESVLAAVVADPHRPVAELPLLTPGERERLAAEWTGTAMPYPEQCLHELVATQVRARPGAVAVEGPDHRLTYRELDEWARALAARLRELGVGPETRVGVCVPRSAEMVVSVLAVLMAGGAYVPLDPAHPADRLTRLIARTGAAVCLAKPGLAELSVPMVDPAAYRAAAESPLPEVGVDGLAAVYFTSGSSGEPKCVQITHRNWVNRIVCMGRDHRLDPGERVLHKTTLSFDDAAVEIFWPLTSGGCVAVLGAGDERSPASILEAARAHRARHLFLVPSMLSPIVTQAERGPEILSGLRTVFTSGEPLTPALARRFYEVAGSRGPRLVNHWGVTEAGIDSTAYACTPDDGHRRQVPIGQAIGNVRVHVLDAAMRPVPLGVVGELYVGGAGVGRGYLGEARLTAERFLPDPYAAVPGARLYRTGDLVRRLPSGDLEFIGRQDHQVKVRGNRVELGEVEAALESFTGVRRAVAVVKPEAGRPLDGEGAGDRGNELVAYVVPTAGGDVRIADLRAHLRARVPSYMVPNAFVVLDSLPTLPSGKVDRAALPDRDGSRPELESAFVAPRTYQEEVLAGLWREILGIERIGVHDDFFDLGGHSLRAAVLAARIEAAFDAPVPLRAFLEHPTIEALARLVTGQEAALPHRPR